MSWLSQGYKKVIKPIKGTLGKVIDTGSDFLPPGWREAGNFAGKRLQGQSTKQAILGAAMDYGVGKVSKGLSNKLSGVGKGGFDLSAANASGNAATNSVMNATKNVGSGIDWGNLSGHLASGMTNNSGGFLDGLKKVGGNVLQDQVKGGGQDSRGWLDKLTGGNGIGGAIGNIGGFINDHKDTALGAAALAESYKNSRKADDYRKQGLNFANDSWKAREGLRKVGVAGMMNETRPDLSEDFYDPNNPFARPMRRVR
jgi:hypothetical protein